MPLNNRSPMRKNERNQKQASDDMVAAKKFIITGVVAITAWFRKLFKRSEPSASETQPGVS